MLNKVTFRATFITLCTMLSAGAYAIADAPTRVDIPAGELSVALLKLSKQYGADLVYRPEQVYGLKTHGAHGSLTTEQAVTQLLQGTVLELRTDPSGAMLIAPPASGSEQVTGSASPTSAAPPQDASDASKEGKKSSSADFRVAQVAQGATSRTSTVGASNQSAASNQSNGPALTEIIVTATKREERLIDTPQSVSVLTSDDLRKIGAVQFQDFANTVPGLSFTTNGPGFTQVTLRGVTAGFDVNSTVGIYVDDVPFGTSGAFAQGAQSALDVGLFDIDRVEILRGPQGTLYGASTMGGLIKYVTKRPDLNDFSADVQAGVSDTNEGGVNYVGDLALNAPLIADKAAVRLSGFYSREGGFIDNVALRANDVNRSGVYGGRADLLLTPTEALTIRVAGFLQNISTVGDGTADYLYSGSRPLYGSLGQSRQLLAPFEQQFRLGSATVAYDFGLATLTSISAYQTVKSQYFIDESQGSLLPLFQLFNPGFSAAAEPFSANTDKFTQEMRLASASTATLEWQVGGFYSHETSNRQLAIVPIDRAAPPVSPGTYFYESTPSHFEEYAAYGDLTWHILPRFDVTGGIRYAENRQRFEEFGSGLFSSSSPLSTSSESVKTYLGNARYRFSEHSTGYARFATGYRPGGPNYIANDPVTGKPVGQPTFQSDTLRSYEAGWKGETSDGRFGIDIDGYHIDWNNIQVLTSSASGFTVFANAPGGAVINGSEVTLSVKPIVGLAVSGAFAFQHAYLKDGDPDLGAPAGAPLPNVARFTAAINSDYLLPFGTWKPTVGAAIRYVDARQSSFEGNATYLDYRLPPYTLTDLRFSFAPNPGRVYPVSVQIYAHNIFDERAQLSAIFTQPTGNHTAPVAIAQPRTIGIFVSAHF